MCLPTPVVFDFFFADLVAMRDIIRTKVFYLTVRRCYLFPKIIVTN
jgi:hypothetical protein